MKIILAITGPTGAGKSTISERLAKQLDHCVNIDADHIKHMVVSGFYKDETNAGGWSFNKWDLVGDSIGLLTKNFLNSGYSVVINGYIDEPAWTNIHKHVTLDYKVLLLPEVEAIEQRDAGRLEDIRMGSDSVKEHYTHFSTDKFYDDFIKLDTTGQTVQESVDEIVKLLVVNH